MLEARVGVEEVDLAQGWLRWSIAAVLCGWVGIATAQQAEVKTASDPVRVRASSGTLAGLLVKRVDPVYPESARALHVNGAVVLRVLISTTGEVDAVQAVSGPPILFEAFMDAVQQWKYKPYTLNGKAVEVETILTMTYQFGGDGSASTAVGVEEQAALAVPPVSVAWGTMAGRLISKVDAILPGDIASEIKGQVVLDAIIAKTGDVESLNAVSGAPLLLAPTINAVRQWKYKPYVLGGGPVEVKTTIRVGYIPAGTGEPRMVVLRGIGNGVSAPTLIYSPEAHFDQEAVQKARLAGWHFGTPVVHLIVDEQGFPANIELVHGYALSKSKDDSKPAELQEALDVLHRNFLEAVKLYRFKPAMENGKPVAVELNVSVNVDVF